MQEWKEEQETVSKKTPEIVFASIVKDAQGHFTLSLMPVAYLEARYGTPKKRSEPHRLLN